MIKICINVYSCVSHSNTHVLCGFDVLDGKVKEWYIIWYSSLVWHQKWNSEISFACHTWNIDFLGIIPCELVPFSVCVERKWIFVDNCRWYSISVPTDLNLHPSKCEGAKRTCFSTFSTSLKKVWNKFNISYLQSSSEDCFQYNYKVLFQFDQLLVFIHFKSNRRSEGPCICQLLNGEYATSNFQV